MAKGSGRRRSTVIITPRGDLRKSEEAREALQETVDRTTGGPTGADRPPIIVTNPVPRNNNARNPNPTDQSTTRTSGGDMRRAGATAEATEGTTAEGAAVTPPTPTRAQRRAAIIARGSRGRDTTRRPGPLV